MRRPARVQRPASLALAGVAVVAVALATLTCGSPSGTKAAATAHGAATQAGAGPAAGTVPPDAASRAAAVAAWDVVYGVLTGPRCANCHPAADSPPLQGDAMAVHAQLVQRGPGGHGVLGMRCAACHQDNNLEAAHLPPGAPNWHMPRPDMPLTFVGVGKRALCEQLRDQAHNGGKTPEQLYEHMASDPLVLWGWDPGPGRAPVPVPHAEVVAAMAAWVDGGCGCPED